MSRCLFIGMMPKQFDPSKPAKLSKKYPVLIKSPFRPGHVITLDDIQRAIEENPGLVYNVYPNEKELTTSIEVQTLGFLGTKTTSILQDHLQKDVIIEHQKRDLMCKQRVEQISTLKNFYIHQGILYRKTPDQTGDSFDPHEGRICIPKSLIATLIAYYHVSNHCGPRALFNQIRHRYYCYGLFAQIVHFCQCCYLCMICKSHQTRQPFNEKPYYPLRRMST